MRSEIRRQQSNAMKVYDLLVSRAGQWVSWRDIAVVGGACAWRTRVADARKRARDEGARIDWNRKHSSAYRYVPAAVLQPERLF